VETLSPIKFLNIPEVEEYFSKGLPYIVVILDDWCPASQEFKPIVEYFAEKYLLEIPIIVMRSENLKKINRFIDINDIKYIPFTIFMLGKTVLAEVPGAMRFNDFKTAVVNLLNFKAQNSICA
jgi:hypothetical protein